MTTKPNTPPLVHAKMNESPPNVLILRPDALGEYILFSAILPALRKKYASSRLTLLCSPVVAELAMRNPMWDAVVIWDRPQSEKNPRYDEIIFQPLLAQSWHTVLYPVTSRETKFDQLILSLHSWFKIGIEGDESFQTEIEIHDGNLYYSRLLISPKSKKSEHDRIVAMAHELGLDMEVPLVPELCIESGDHKLARDALKKTKEKPIIVFIGQGAAIRSWGGYKYQQVVNWLLENTLHPIWLCGPQRDAVEAHAICTASSQEARVENHCGKYSIPVLAALLAQSKLVIGPESGPLHLAASVGTPNLVIMGGGQPNRFLPWSETTRVVNHPTACYDCKWNCDLPKPLCITEITVDKVINELSKMLRLNLVMVDN